MSAAGIVTANIIVRRADSDEDKNSIFRFRYRVYVEEQGRYQRHADHKDRTVSEPLDRTARLYGAWKSDRLVGTVRSNFSRDGGLDEYSDLYEMDAADQYHPSATSVTTKLIVSDGLRGHMTAIRLCKATFLDGLASGILFNFIDCSPERPRTVALFEAFGYVRSGEVRHPEYGVAIKLVMCLSDADRFAACRSPFHKFVWTAHDPAAVSHFNYFIGRDQRGANPETCLAHADGKL